MTTGNSIGDVPSTADDSTTPGANASRPGSPISRTLSADPPTLERERMAKLLIDDIAITRSAEIALGARSAPRGTNTPPLGADVTLSGRSRSGVSGWTERA